MGDFHPAPRKDNHPSSASILKKAFLQEPLTVELINSKHDCHHQSLSLVIRSQGRCRPERWTNIDDGRCKVPFLRPYSPIFLFPNADHILQLYLISNL
jgi:hypothetical protein